MLNTNALPGAQNLTAANTAASESIPTARVPVNTQEALPRDPVKELSRQVVALRASVNDCIRRAEAAKSRAQAVIATNAPSQAHRDYAQKLLGESRALRIEAWELSQSLIRAEATLAEIRRASDVPSGKSSQN